jgi:hypothetical protein
MRKDKAEYQSKVTLDNGLVRGRVPSPLLQGLSAKRGDRLTFRRVDLETVTMSLTRAKKKPRKKRR